MGAVVNGVGRLWDMDEAVDGTAKSAKSLRSAWRGKWWHFVPQSEEV